MFCKIKIISKFFTANSITDELDFSEVIEANENIELLKKLLKELEEGNAISVRITELFELVQVRITGSLLYSEKKI